MIRNILVPIDFSENAMKAAQYAVSIAKKCMAKVYLLHIIEPVTDSIRQPNPLHERLEVEITRNRINDMKEFQGYLAAASPALKIEMEIAHGMVIHSILNYADQKKIDLIVMGTQGATGLKQVFLGSVTAGTIGRTKIPVLAVPDDYQAEEPDGILLATSRFEQNSVLLDNIVELARLFHTMIHVAVFLDIDISSTDDYSNNDKKLDQYIRFLKKTYPDVSFTGELLEGKKLEEAFEEYITKNEVDIISMITYPKNIWQKLLKKSKTRKIVTHSAIPVLAIPSA